MEELPRRTGRPWRRAALGAGVAVVAAAAVAGGYAGLHRTGAAVRGGYPAARAFAAMAYDASTGDVVMFGGAGAGGRVLGDTWLWDGSAWSQAAPSQSPPPRYGAQMAWDPRSHRVILLGGTGGSACSAPGEAPGQPGGGAAGCGPLQDAWAWDGSTWSRLDLGTGAGSLGDRSLSGAQMVTDPGKGEVVLLTSATWPPLPVSRGSGVASPATGGPVSSPVTAVTSPVPVAAATSTDPGGTPAATPIPCSVCPTPLGGGARIACPLMPPRAEPAGGGPGCVPPCASTGSPSPEPACHPCIWNGTASGAGSSVAGSAEPACPVCPAPGRGQTGPPSGAEPACPPCAGESLCLRPGTTDTWVLDGTAFHEVATPATGSPPAYGELAWFPATAELADFVAGPRIEMGVPGAPEIACAVDGPCPAAERSVWTWDGVRWSSQTLSGSYQPLLPAAALVSDDAAREVVAFDAAGRTWVASAPTGEWREEAPAHSPTPRSGAAMAYDPATGRVVLFGGETHGSSGSVPADDTWSWSSGDWAHLSGPLPPPPAAPSPVPLPASPATPIPTPAGPSRAAPTIPAAPMG
jgi:hypothetical protein